jgi:hypothetical protein
VISLNNKFVYLRRKKMSNRRIACWMSEKKICKINWVEFGKTSLQHDFRLFKLDLNKSLESQGPFCVLLHKLTDIIASADQGDPKVSLRTCNSQIIAKITVRQSHQESRRVHRSPPICHRPGPHPERAATFEPLHILQKNQLD